MAGIGSRRLFRVVKCGCTEHGWLTIGVRSGVDGKWGYRFSFSMHRDRSVVCLAGFGDTVRLMAQLAVRCLGGRGKARAADCSSANTALADLPVAVCKYRRQVVIELTNATSVLTVAHSKRQWFPGYE